VAQIVYTMPSGQCFLTKQRVESAIILVNIASLFSLLVVHAAARGSSNNLRGAGIEQRRGAKQNDGAFFPRFG
jgi:hypothetical protein